MPVQSMQKISMMYVCIYGKNCTDMWGYILATGTTQQQGRQQQQQQQQQLMERCICLRHYTETQLLALSVDSKDLCIWDPYTKIYGWVFVVIFLSIRFELTLMFQVYFCLHI